MNFYLSEGFFAESANCEADAAKNAFYREFTEADAVEELPVATTDKKSRSKLTRLFRKLSAQKSVDFVECKSTISQLPRKEMYTSKMESDRSEVFATPATSRRLFSLSRNRPQRQRALSETCNSG